MSSSQAQRAAQPSDAAKAETLEEFLALAKLEQYAGSLRKLGVTRIDHLQDLLDDDLAEIGLRKIEIKRFRRMMTGFTQSARGRGGSPAPVAALTPATAPSVAQPQPPVYAQAQAQAPPGGVVSRRQQPEALLLQQRQQQQQQQQPAHAIPGPLAQIKVPRFVRNGSGKDGYTTYELQILRPQQGGFVQGHVQWSQAAALGKALQREYGPLWTVSGLPTKFKSADDEKRLEKRRGQLEKFLGDTVAWADAQPGVDLWQSISMQAFCPECFRPGSPGSTSRCAPASECAKEKPTAKTWPTRFVKIEGRSLNFYEKENDSKGARGSSIADVTGCLIHRGVEKFTLRTQKTWFLIKLERRDHADFPDLANDGFSRFAFKCANM